MLIFVLAVAFFALFCGTAQAAAEPVGTAVTQQNGAASATAGPEDAAECERCVDTGSLRLCDEPAHGAARTTPAHLAPHALPGPRPPEPLAQQPCAPPARCPSGPAPPAPDLHLLQRLRV